MLGCARLSGYRAPVIGGGWLKVPVMRARRGSAGRGSGVHGPRRSVRLVRCTYGDLRIPVVSQNCCRRPTYRKARDPSSVARLSVPGARNQQRRVTRPAAGDQQPHKSRAPIRGGEGGTAFATSTPWRPGSALPLRVPRRCRTCIPASRRRLPARIRSATYLDCVCRPTDRQDAPPGSRRLINRSDTPTFLREIRRAPPLWGTEKSPAPSRRFPIREVTATLFALLGNGVRLVGPSWRPLQLDVPDVARPCDSHGDSAGLTFGRGFTLRPTMVALRAYPGREARSIAGGRHGHAHLIKNLGCRRGHRGGDGRVVGTSGGGTG